MKIALAMSDEWHVVTDEPDCVSTAGKKSLADLQDHEFIDCNTESNANLIAAGPDMLAALEMMLRWQEYDHPTAEACFARARSAVAKAKGQQV